MMIIVVDLIKLVPKEVSTYIAHIKDKTAMITKFGGTVLGWYMLEGGGHEEIVLMTRWPTLESRSKALHEAIKDAAYMKLNNEVAKCVDTVTNFICYPNAGVHIDPKWTTSKHVVLRMFRVEGPQGEAAKKYLECVRYMKEKGKTGGPHVTALLHTVGYSTQPVGIIAITENKDMNFDEMMEEIVKFETEPPVGSPLMEYFKIFTTTARRLLTPLTPEMITTLAAQHQCH